jgi:hypothetical protein
MLPVTTTGRQVLVLRPAGPAQGTLGAAHREVVLEQPGHGDGQLVRRQPVRVVEDGGDRQVLAADRPVDDDAQAADRREGVDGAPVAARPVVVEDQHRLVPHRVGELGAARRPALEDRRPLRRHLGHLGPAVAAAVGLPTLPKNSTMPANRALPLVCAATMPARAPAPAGPNSGRAETMFVK